MKESILPIYAQAVDELNLQTYDRGLYGKALCDANGEESLARVYYIRARVAHIVKANKGLTNEIISKLKVSHTVDSQVSRYRVRRRRSSTSDEDSTDIAVEPSSNSSFRFRRSYDSMVNLFVRWTAL